MGLRPADFETSTWEVKGHRLRIEYSLAVLEQIRCAVVDAFYALPRGGIEVGGVLFGTREDSLVRISAFRALPCEHAMGPAFVLSEKDEAALRALLQAPENDRSLEGLLPVGWYHSHTRSEVTVSEQDLAVYDRYFPEPWQVTLVLRPCQTGAMRAGFFFREADGTVRTESSHREFVLLPGSRAGAGASEAGSEVLTAPGPNGAPAASRAVPAAATGRAPIWSWLAAAAVLAFVGIGLAARLFVHQPAAPLSLRALDVDGQLVITWDRGAEPVLEARKGALDIVDGTRKTHFELGPERLHRGSFVYARQAERVDLRLSVQREGSEPADEVLTFLGRPVTLASASELEAIRQRDKALRERDQFARDAERLRSALKAETARNAKLEQAMRILRQQLQAELSRPQR